jgi:streptogramin lyase
LALTVSMLVWMPGAAVGATPDYYPLPTGHTIAGGVTADGAGSIWFGVQGVPRGSQPTPSLVRLIPAQASPGTSDGMAAFPTPDPSGVNCCGNQLRSVTFNPEDGKLYYVRSDGNVGHATPAAMVPGQSTAISSTMLPGYQDLWDIAPSPDGGAWFTEHSASNVAPTYYGDRIAYYNGGAPVEGPNVAIQNGNTTLNGLRYSAQPAGIAVGEDGRPWFVEENPGNPGYRVATYSGSGDNYEEYLVSPCESSGSPCSGSFTGTGLTDVAIAPDGGIWFTNVLNKKFGRMDPSTHAMVHYTMASLGLAAASPRQITTAPDGTLWMTAYQGFTGATQNALVRIVPSATAASATVYKTSVSNPPLSVGADNAGNIWFGVGNPSAPSLVGRLAGVVGADPDPDPGPDADPGTGGTGGGGGAGGSGIGGAGGGTTPTPPVVGPVPSVTPPIPLKPATMGQAKLDPPQTGNGAVNTNQICVGPPEARCSLVYLIKEHEYVTGFPSSVNKKRKKQQPRVLGTKTVTLKGGQSAKVTVKLNKLGKRILKGKHKLKIVFSATQKLPNGKTKTVTRKTLTLRSK